MSTELIHAEDVLNTKGFAQKFNAKSPLKWKHEQEFVKRQLENNPKLLECTQDSIIAAFMQGASMGLSFNPSLQHVYLIPYGFCLNPDQKGKDRIYEQRAYASPSYRGLTYLATQGGAIQYMRADVIIEGDIFTYYGASEKPLFQAKNMKGRTVDRAVGVFAIAKTSTGDTLCEMMTREAVTNARECSKQSGSLMWTKFWEEGWKKTCLRRLFKTLPSASKWMLNSIEVMAEHEGLAKRDESVVATIDEYINLDQQTVITDKLDDLRPEKTDAQVFQSRFLSSIGAVEIDKIPVGLYESAVATLDAAALSKGSAE